MLIHPLWLNALSPDTHIHTHRTEEEEKQGHNSLSFKRTACGRKSSQERLWVYIPKYVSDQTVKVERKKSAHSAHTPSKRLALNPIRFQYCQSGSDCQRSCTSSHNFKAHVKQVKRIFWVKCTLKSNRQHLWDFVYWQRE